jgi:hypothetical protein
VCLDIDPTSAVGSISPKSRVAAPTRPKQR